MITAQNICGSSIIKRGPGETFSAIKAPSKIAVVPEPGMPSVNSGTNVSYDNYVSENAIEVYVARVRKHLEGSKVTITTARGMGYRLDSE